MKIEYKEPTDETEEQQPEPEAKLQELADLRSLNIQTLVDAGIRIETEDRWAYNYPIRIPYPTLGDTVWYERLMVWPGSSHTPRYRTPADAERHLYNPFGHGPGDPVVWLCEGEWDTLATHEAGYAAVGIQGVNGFRGLWRHLFFGGHLVLAFDGDDAGRVQALSLKEKLKGEGLSVHMFDPGDDLDMNDLHVKGVLGDMCAAYLKDIGVES